MEQVGASGTQQPHCKHNVELLYMCAGEVGPVLLGVQSKP